MKKIQLVEFRELVPNPSKGVSARSNFEAAFSYKEGELEIFRSPDGILLSAPKNNREFEVPWATVKFVDYGQVTRQEDTRRSSEKDSEKGRSKS